MSRQDDENCHRNFLLVQWQLSYKETVKHELAVWNMPRITTLYERRFVLDIVGSRGRWMSYCGLQKSKGRASGTTVDVLSRMLINYWS